MSQRRQTAAAPLADLIEACVSPALRRQGFASSDILVNWDEIVGARLAGRSEPLEIRWPRRPPRADPEAPGEAATLICRVEGAFALEFEYGAALIIERINAHYGWRCLGRIIIKQGPVTARPAPRPVPPPLAVEARTRLAGLVEGAEPPLAAALTRLGEGVLRAPAARRAAEK